MPDSDAYSDNELGRRILAAVLSYQMRLRSLDYTLRTHIPKIVDPSWARMGQALLRFTRPPLEPKDLAMLRKRRR